MTALAVNSTRAMEFTAMIEALPAACQRDPAAGRRIFDAIIAELTDPDGIAKMELAREYFCSPKFARAIADYVWAINNPEC